VNFEGKANQKRINTRKKVNEEKSRRTKRRGRPEKE